MPNPTKDELFALVDQALKVYPDLTSTGLASRDGTDAKGLYDEERLRYCFDFLSLLDRQKTVTMKYGSYFLKHCVEDWGSYRGWIGEGYLIAVACGMGFTMKRFRDGCFLNITKKSLKPLSGGRIR